MKPSAIDDTPVDMRHELIITPLSVHSSHRALSRGHTSKMTVKVPCVELETQKKRPLTSNRHNAEAFLFRKKTPVRSHSFSRIQRKPASFTPHVIEMSLEEQILQPNCKMQKLKKLKPRKIHTAKEVCVTENNEDDIIMKLSNVMIPLPYSENKKMEIKRSTHRLRKLRRVPFRIDKENDMSN
jgi:hypothetical protein